jgi:hypothetical protein
MRSEIPSAAIQSRLVGVVGSKDRSCRCDSTALKCEEQLHDLVQALSEGL